ncbi:TolC family protein, partial [Anaeromyxobacter sp. PSR-1]|uniref:TolC family protein n=1 Tax=Anaeromyxobacter sp. PSR-1 TaxID=1300915 RepID=UPI001364D7EA
MIRIAILAALAAIPLAVRAEAPLTLAAALEEAQRASPDLAAARARLDQARAASDRVRAGYLPQVKVGATYTRNSDEAKLELPVGYTIRDTGAPTSGAGLPGAPTPYA